MIESPLALISKYVPIYSVIGALVITGMAYGEIKTDITNLQNTENQHFSLIETQLNQIQNIIANDHRP